MTTALEGGEGSASLPDRSLPPGMTWYQLYRKLGGPQGQSGQVRKISPPLGFDPRTVPPIASHYTNYTTRPTIYTKAYLNVKRALQAYIFPLIFSCYVLKYNTWLQAGWFWDWILVGTRDFPFSKTSTSSKGTTQPPQCVQVFFPQVKQQEHELTTHLHHSAQVREWCYTSACPVCLHGVELDSFTFIILSFFLLFFILQHVGFF